MITNSFAWYQRFIAIHTTSYAWCVFKEKEFLNLHQVWNVVQTRNIIPQDFLILVIRKKSSWGLGRRWKGRGQWVGGDIIAPPRHPQPPYPLTILVSPNPNPILSPNSFVRTFSTQPSGEPIKLYFQIFIRFWSHPCITFFRRFFPVNTFLIWTLHVSHSSNWLCSDVSYDCPIFL